MAVPRRALPYTPSGKLQHGRLRRRIADGEITPLVQIGDGG
jgi:hypothetical protein